MWDTTLPNLPYRQSAFVYADQYFIQPLRAYRFIGVRFWLRLHELLPIEWPTKKVHVIFFEVTARQNHHIIGLAVINFVRHPSMHRTYPRSFNIHIVTFIERSS